MDFEKILAESADNKSRLERWYALAEDGRLLDATNEITALTEREAKGMLSSAFGAYASLKMGDEKSAKAAEKSVTHFFEVMGQGK